MEKKTFNKKQIKKLDAVRQLLFAASKMQYTKASTSKQRDLCADMLEEIGISVRRDYNCSRCVYNLFKQCGDIYFRSVDLIAEESEPTNETDTTTEEVTEKKTNKQGKKSKDK